MKHYNTIHTVTLLEPQIPPNTGNIARLCAATNTPLHIVGEIGFKLTDKYLKRAGLDYWKYVDWTYFEDVDSYMQKLVPEQIHLFTTKTENSYLRTSYHIGDVLLFGSETSGINTKYLSRYPDRCRTIPIINPGVRSLNLSSSVAMALSEAIRQADTTE